MPDEAIDILTVTFDVFVDFSNCLLTFNSLLVALIYESCKLFELCTLQEPDIHHVDESPAVLHLLLGFIEIHVKLLEGWVAKLLLNCVHEGFKGKRERWFDCFNLLHVAICGKAEFAQQRYEMHPLRFREDDTLRVISCLIENFLEFLFVVDVRGSERNVLLLCCVAVYYGRGHAYLNHFKFEFCANF